MLLFFLSSKNRVLLAQGLQRVSWGKLNERWSNYLQKWMLNINNLDLNYIQEPFDKLRLFVS